MSDLISRQAAIDALRTCYDTETITMDNGDEYINYDDAVGEIEQLPSAQSEIIRCKDCIYYTPMNRETKTGICNLIMHQNFGDNWFCAGAKRRINDTNVDT